MSASADLRNEHMTEARVLINEPLNGYTTWRVGGMAKQLYKPLHLQDVIQFIRALPSCEPILWLGLGSNALISDHGFPGAVIITQGALTDLVFENETTVYVGAGVSCAKFARFCARESLKDTAFWAGIPGTMGGALRMNAGCHGNETWQFVKKVHCLSRDGTITVRETASFDIGYRDVKGLEQDEWFIGAWFTFEKGDKVTALNQIKTLLEKRANTQPTNEFNCGSVFRNPPNDHAARLIEACGLKGYRIGYAEVSKKHANFIINAEGKATASDIATLMQAVRHTVFEKTGVMLIQEVHMIGEP
jgi:UDP-N-acetylmuramate dehydrogenase